MAVAIGNGLVGNGAERIGDRLIEGIHGTCFSLTHALFDYRLTRFDGIEVR